ncbi:hypothetical protein PAXRUDRAFT_92474, partial [Paxillus rubicundulus Ve08.2h10]
LMAHNSLMYLMLGTCPYITYAVGTLSWFSTTPKQMHWEAAKCVFQYIQATKDMELRFDGIEVSMDMDFQGYSNAGWSQDPYNSCSTSRFLFLSNRGAISWSSKQQSMVALSTTESEYIGLSLAGQHLACHHPQFRVRTKHIQRKYHFIQDDLVGKGEAVIRYMPTDDMVADILTKPL